MATQTFPAGTAPRIVLNNCSGDLDIEVWDERAIEAETDGTVNRIGQSDEALVIEDVDGDLRLRVPADAEVLIDQVSGRCRLAMSAAMSRSRISMGQCGSKMSAAMSRFAMSQH